MFVIALLTKLKGHTGGNVLPQMGVGVTMLRNQMILEFLF